MTAAGAASMTMLEVVCSAMGACLRVVAAHQGPEHALGVRAYRIRPSSRAQRRPRLSALPTPAATGRRRAVRVEQEHPEEARVREFSTALRRAPRHRATSPTTSSRNATEHADDRRVLAAPRPATAWRATSPPPSSSQEVSAVAKGLVAAGIEAGDRVALISRTRYEWTLLDYAIWFAGAVTVPVYETSSRRADRAGSSDSGARAVVAETADHVARVHERRGRPAGARPRLVASTTTPSTCSRRLGARHPRRRARGAAYDGDARSTWPR